MKTTYENGQLSIPEGTLVVLSGLPGSGKSHLKQSGSIFPERAVWVSTDTLRDAISPALPMAVNGAMRLRRNEATNDAVFAIARLQVEAALRMGRTVVMDATNVTDADRQAWVSIADGLGVPHLVVILDTPLETCLQRADFRVNYVPEASIRAMDQPAVTEVPETARLKKNGAKQDATAPLGFQRTSRFNHQVLQPTDTVKFCWNELDSDKWDVVGDVHGLFDELLALLTKAGWVIQANRLIGHPAGKKLLFLGDLVDRGLQSIEVVRFVKRAVDDGLAEALKGNHEKKLIRFIEAALSGTLEDWTSFANAETGMEFLKLEAWERDALTQFLKRLPPYVLHAESNTVFIHANVNAFTLGASTADDMLYGCSVKGQPSDTDARYQEGVALGVNQLTVVRGHIPQTSEQCHIFSLERHPFQNGELMLLKFDEVAPVFARTNDAATRIAAFKAARIEHHCEFDFDEYSKRYQLAKGLNRLVASKHAFVSRDPSGLFKTFKYSKSTFWNNGWDASPLLLKARGLVMDYAGNIVSHPFDKVFNYLENGTGKDLDDATPVVATDKLNGFLGVISGHPLKKGELLVHTQGSFESDFVTYIRDHLSPTPKGQIQKYLSRVDVTLMFEVLHASDPHIIEYESDMMGLHLIGVRGKGQFDEAWDEARVDGAAAEMGLRRPNWSRMTFGAVRQMVRTTRTEGVMVRADTPNQEFLLKIKSPFYLSTKFFSRMGVARQKHLFGNPMSFKKTVDEEFYVLVDTLTQKYTLDAFLDLGEDEKLTEVRALINQLQ